MAALPCPCLMLVTDRHQSSEGGLPEVVAEAVEGGVNAVQLREKDLSPVELLALGSLVRDAVAGRASFIVNSHVGIARALDADGVQLPESGAAVAEARRVLGPGSLIGRSVHSVEGARAAEAEGADYLVFGPVYETSSHPGAAPTGVRALEAVVRAVAIPVLAIGGVTPAKGQEVMETGAAGVAVISAILGAPDPRAAAVQLASALGVAPSLSAGPVEGATPLTGPRRVGTSTC